MNRNPVLHSQFERLKELKKRKTFEIPLKFPNHLSGQFKLVLLLSVFGMKLYQNLDIGLNRNEKMNQNLGFG